jgi:hypothetical protein
MARFIKIGSDVVNLEAITRISLIMGQSGYSDRLLISMGDATVTVDSALGRERMMRISQKLLAALSVEDWDENPN